LKLDNFTGALFKGSIPSAPGRFLVRVLRIAAKRGVTHIVNPCCGAFGFALVAAKAGFEPSKITTGDIGLMSAIVGTAIAGRKLSELGIRYVDERLAPAARFAGSAIEAGAALAAIKACQYKPTSVFTRLLLEDITGDWERAATGLQEQIEARRAKLQGCAFELEDMFVQIRRASDDPHTAICVFPPAYRNGYETMFPIAGRISWSAEPKVQQYDPAWQKMLYELLRDGRALALFGYYGELPEDGADRAIFSEWAPNRKVAQWYLANRPDGLPKDAYTRRETKLAPSAYPLWPAGRAVTAQTVVRFVETTKSVAQYYRDLFAHKLGVTNAEHYFLVLLDGHVMSVFGMFFDYVRRGVTEVVHETFGFSVPSAVHGRLNRLFMMILVSGEAARYFRSLLSNPLRVISSLQTTCIAQYPELKINRGILTLRGRERMPDGRYKIDYVATFNERSCADVVAVWLKKDGPIPPPPREGGGPEPEKSDDGMPVTAT